MMDSYLIIQILLWQQSLQTVSGHGENIYGPRILLPGKWHTDHVQSQVIHEWKWIKCAQHVKC